MKGGDDFHKQDTVPDIDAHYDALPKKIGPYKIESLLDKGGMSILYLGLPPDSPHPVVIKVLLPKYLKNKEIASRFLKEAEIIGMTKHPNIVQLYGQGKWEKGLYIAMEFIRGVSLRQFIQQKSLSKRRALEIILQVAYALSHLHAHGVIHRDLKPENILITETGDVKVIDFGIAQLLEEVGEERLTQKRRMMGTPTYMSPEQKESPLEISYSSDIYALGIITYELILGRLSHGIIHLSLLPKNLRMIIEKALQLDPKKRYQDIVDFITDISHYIETLNEERDEKEEDIADEVLNVLQLSRDLLISKKAPPSSQIEVGIAVQEGLSQDGLYLDFLPLSGNKTCVVLAEALDLKAHSLFHSSILRGYVRMAVQTFFQTKKSEHGAVSLLKAINKALCEDPMKQTFSCTLLLLDPDQNQLSLASCESASLWHIPEGSQTVRALSTPNPALGIDPNPTFLETVDNWEGGDTLLLHSGRIKEEKDQAEIQRHLLLPPQAMAEKILSHFLTSKTASPKRTAAVISIQRLL